MDRLHLPSVAPGRIVRSSGVGACVAATVMLLAAPAWAITRTPNPPGSADVKTDTPTPTPTETVTPPITNTPTATPSPTPLFGFSGDGCTLGRSHAGTATLLLPLGALFLLRARFRRPAVSNAAQPPHD